MSWWSFLVRDRKGRGTSRRGWGLRMGKIRGHSGPRKSNTLPGLTHHDVKNPLIEGGEADTPVSYRLKSSDVGQGQGHGRVVTTTHHLCVTCKCPSYLVRYHYYAVLFPIYGKSLESNIGCSRSFCVPQNSYLPCTSRDTNSN